MLQYVIGIISYAPKLNIRSTNKGLYFEDLEISSSISFIPSVYKSVGISP